MRALVFFLALMLSTPTQAQYLGPAPMIGGAHVSCYGIPTVVAPINDLALAVPGQIVLSPQLFSYHPLIQLFVYAHECAHHVNGANEMAADCWAIRLGRDQNWMNRQGVNIVAASLVDTAGDWTHAPGRLRVQQLIDCFES